MPGLCFANKLIFEDEHIHVDFGALLFNMLVNNNVTEDDFHAMMLEAFECEKHYITEGLPVNLIGMNQGLMVEYVKSVANTLCEKLRFGIIFPGAKNPFPWMKMIEIDEKANLHERQNANYELAAEEDIFELDYDLIS